VGVGTIIATVFPRCALTLRRLPVTTRVAVACPFVVAARARRGVPGADFKAAEDTTRVRRSRDEAQEKEASSSEVELHVGKVSYGPRELKETEVL